MTFEELLTHANSHLETFLSEEKCEPISERTLRYWISKGILEKRTTRGPKTTYPTAAVWRVVLTRQYQLFTTKTLTEIAAIQATMADKNVRYEVENFKKNLSEESIASGSNQRANQTNRSSNTSAEGYLSQAIRLLRREIQSLSKQLKSSSHEPYKMPKHAMESADVSRLQASRFLDWDETDVNESFDVSRLQASRLENLFESEKRLAELRHKQVSEVSQELLDRLIRSEQGTGEARQHLARVAEALLKEVDSLRHRLSDEVSEHLEREAAAAQAAREDLANLAKELRLEMKSLRSDLLKIQEQLTSEKGDS